MVVVLAKRDVVYRGLACFFAVAGRGFVNRAMYGVKYGAKHGVFLSFRTSGDRGGSPLFFRPLVATLRARPSFTHFLRSRHVEQRVCEFEHLWIGV